MNTTDNQVTAQVKAEPTVAKLLPLQPRLKGEQNKRVAAINTHAALLAKVVRANKQLVKVGCNTPTPFYKYSHKREWWPY